MMIAAEVVHRLGQLQHGLQGSFDSVLRVKIPAVVRPDDGNTVLGDELRLERNVDLVLFARLQLGPSRRPVKPERGLMGDDQVDPLGGRLLQDLHRRHPGRAHREDLRLRISADQTIRTVGTPGLGIERSQKLVEFPHLPTFLLRRCILRPARLPLARRRGEGRGQPPHPGRCPGNELTPRNLVRTVHGLTPPKEDAEDWPKDISPISVAGTRRVPSAGYGTRRVPATL